MHLQYSITFHECVGQDSVWKASSTRPSSGIHTRAVSQRLSPGLNLFSFCTASICPESLVMTSGQMRFINLNARPHGFKNRNRGDYITYFTSVIFPKVRGSAYVRMLDVESMVSWLPPGVSVSLGLTFSPKTEPSARVIPDNASTGMNASSI